MCPWFLKLPIYSELCLDSQVSISTFITSKLGIQNGINSIPRAEVWKVFIPYIWVGGHPCDTPGISILHTLVLPVIKADLTEQQGPPTTQACFLCCSTIRIITCLLTYKHLSHWPLLLNSFERNSLWVWVFIEHDKLSKQFCMTSCSVLHSQHPKPIPVFQDDSTLHDI